MPRTSSDQLDDNLYDVMMEMLPSLMKEKVTEQVKKEVPAQTACRSSAVRTRDQDDPHDDAHPKGENSAKRQKTSEYEAYVSGESSSGQVNVEEPGPSTSAKLKKMADEMLRQRCTSGDEHQYHIDQMKNFLQSDIVWESRKEILVSPHPQKITPLVQSCQRDPEAPALSLINQDLLYLKKGNSGPEKIVLSLHKFPAIVFNDDDIEERTSRWVNKCIKKFNPYARYGVENWKNPHAKIFYIRRQKEPGRPKEEIYSNSKIVQVIKTFWELGHEHKFITEIVARRANDCIVSITEPDYKNLNKNDIEDMYLLIMNNKVPDYADTGLLWSLSVFIRSSVIWERVHDFQLGIESYQQKINLTAPTITFPGIEECDVFSIVYEPVHGIIYTNSKKEKRVMRPSEIHKFCDATLRRTLEGLKSYYNDVKYGYVQKELTNDELEFLKLFEEEIEVRLKYRDQIRRWEIQKIFKRSVLIPALPYLTGLILSHGNNEFDYTVREKITESTYFSLLIKAHSRWDGAEMRLLQGAQYKAGNANAGQGKPINCYNCNRIGHIARNCIQPKRPQNSDYFKEKMLLMQAQENGVDLDEEQMLFLAGGQTNTFDDEVDEGPVQDMAQNENNVFQADQCDAFDSDVDEAPTAQTMFMANLSSADPVYDEAGPSYDSDTLSEVQDHDNSLGNMNASHEEHEIHNGDNKDQVVHNDVSSVPNDVVMIINNDIYEQDALCVPSNNTANASLTAEPARYKELAKVYEKRAQFKLTKRELMIDTQMRMIIKDRNVKEESLKKELHSVKMQLNSTLNHNKLIREEVSTLKQDFKQKENKLLKEFLDMKHLKEKVEDKLYKQDQSLQTVYMLCKPESFYDEVNRVAIGYKNPFYLSKANQVQPALYNGHEIVKTNHARALVHDSEDTLEIAETTRKQMIEKMNDPECVKKKCDEIKRKNLLIENENLIDECLSKDVFYIATDYVLTVSRFSDMHDAYIVAQKRIAELRAENSNLTQNIQRDDHDEMIKHFSRLEVDT
ncbi:retrovirus-related pol polyprotein from transposon TNT 1-94 [Tanacetum coccineum]